MLSLRYPPSCLTRTLDLWSNSRKFDGLVVCGAKGPRPRYPRVWKSRKRIGTISKSQKLVTCIKELSNVKEEVYGALDSFVAWDLEFPLIAVKKAIKTLEDEKEWKRIVQVIKWMFSKGQGKTMGSYHSLLNALAEDGRLEEAEDLWRRIFSQYMESLPRVLFGKMIFIYYKQGMHEKMFEIFADMEELSIKPDKSIVNMMGKVFQKLGMRDKYEKLHKKYPPPKWEYRYIKGKRVRIRVKHLRSEQDALWSLSDQEDESSAQESDLQFNLESQEHSVLPDRGDEHSELMQYVEQDSSSLSDQKDELSSEANHLQCNLVT